MQPNSSNSSSDFASAEDVERFSKSSLFDHHHMGFFRVVDAFEVYEHYAKFAHLGDKNPYAKLIERANFISRMGLTPVYMTNDAGTSLVASSQEHIDRKLN